ncbi:class I SAM-dependent methyltransferase [Methylomonas sp. UP202]|uniref:class I SAM-dependent methyltransferase n=1 Tax=Methylomonas sp. UP202 TaxID=3040943 RepID=UPI0024795D7A|nr:class I SAM-dependent methyltransferase [Methylomonas sp. UP202]WGS84054.1 methyltransferase domain-containing protein [Methylomonas sp. UP202]
MHHYQWNAEDYRQNSSAQQQWAQELIAKLNLTGTETVLDVGCGDGKVTAEIASHLPHGQVIGIDNSEAMIALAKREYPANRYANLLFQRMDARELKFSGRFDVVFSNAVLHWIDDHIPVIAGMYQSLKPGGRVLLQMGARNGMSEFMAALEQVLTLPQWRDYFAGFSCPYGFKSVEDYQTWLPAAGFAIKRLELIEKHAVHSDAEAFKGWIRTTWLPYTEQVPQAKRIQLIEAIATQYLASNPTDANGRVSVLMVRLEVEAEKPRQQTV